MKRLIVLLLLAPVLGLAEDVTLTKSTVIRADRSMVAVKAGTVVALLGRDEQTLTVRYKNFTGTIPAGSIAAPVAGAKKEEPPAAPPAKGAQTNYGRAVEKARENAGTHEKNLVKPTDDVMQEQ